jgi:hypothetical protein
MKERLECTRRWGKIAATFVVALAPVRGDTFPEPDMRAFAWFAVFASPLLAGCGGGKNAPLSAPSYDPGGMAQAAIGQYDKNGNGSLEGAELDAVPSLKFALAGIDKNKDKAVSRDELTARFESYKAADVGALGVSCTVRLNGVPVAGAVVTFVPEDCMKGTVKGGSGTSGDDGITEIQGEGGVPGLAYGLYKITVSKKNAAGGEELPARYHAQTILGREVFADARGGSPTIELNLTSP